MRTRMSPATSLASLRLRVCRVALTLAVLVLLSAGALPAAAQSPATPAPPPADYMAGQLLVRFRHDVPGALLASTRLFTRLQTVQTIRAVGLELVAVEEGREADVLAELQSQPLVEYAGFNYIAHIAGEPNDPAWWRQWDLRQINAPAAWDLSTGSDLIVAVIDTGADRQHPDLASKLVDGYDFANGDSAPDDDHGHGSHVAGIVAAATNNGVGVAGLSWNARIMPLKVLDANGDGSYFNIIQAIRYAADRGARVINLSLGGSQADANLSAAIQYAVDRGCLVVAATGNQGGAVLYPAAYAETLAVAATTDRQIVPDYSNHGPEVDLAAPGGSESAGIYSLAPGGGYATLYGTSMAAPHVAGLAALLWGALPAWSADQIASMLKETARKVGAAPYGSSGRNDYAGYGQIDAAAALQRALQGTQPTPTPRPAPSPTPTPIPTPVLHTLEIPLQAGWNLVSFNVRPADTRIETLTASLRPALELAMGYRCGIGGLSYYPDLPASVSTLATLEAGRGFWLKLREPRTWRVSGEPVDAAAPLGLCAGWNLAGYMPAREWPMPAAVASLGEAFEAALGYRDGQARSYYADLLPQFSTLRSLQPGAGYWMLASGPAILTYPR